MTSRCVGVICSKCSWRHCYVTSGRRCCILFIARSDVTPCYFYILNICVVVRHRIFVFFSTQHLDLSRTAPFCFFPVGALYFSAHDYVHPIIVCHVAKCSKVRLASLQKPLDYVLIWRTLSLNANRFIYRFFPSILRTFEEQTLCDDFILKAEDMLIVWNVAEITN